MDLPPITPKPVALQKPRPGPDTSEATARKTAQAFEAAFLAEMLKYTGINGTPKTGGGGAGEEAFASFLTGEYARLIAERGGVGLAEQIFNAISQKGSGP